MNGGRPTGCALAAPPLIDGGHIVAETSAEKRTISLDAKRRPLQARVGLAFLVWRSLASNYAAFSRLPSFSGTRVLFPHEKKIIQE